MLWAIKHDCEWKYMDTWPMELVRSNTRRPARSMTVLGASMEQFAWMTSFRGSSRDVARRETGQNKLFRDGFRDGDNRWRLHVCTGTRKLSRGTHYYFFAPA